MRTSVVFAALSVGGLLAMADLASAGTVKFQGTRDQVRAACAGPDRELIEGEYGTACIDSAKDTSVLCYDDGSCYGACPSCGTPVKLGSKRQLLDRILGNSIGTGGGVLEPAAPGLPFTPKVAPRGGLGGAIAPAR